MGFKKFCFVTILFLLTLLPLWAVDVATRSIEDDSTLRRDLTASWFTEAPSLVLNSRPRIYTLPGGGRIQIRVEESQDEFCVILARELNGAYPGWAQGSWGLTRSKADGGNLRIRVFLRSDPYTYVQFRPFSGNKSQMDVVLYDSYVIRSQPLAIPFDRIMVVPLEEVLKAAGDTFPRRYFEPHVDDYRDIRSFVSAVRERLPELSFRDDGALDEFGRYVFIETQNAQNGQGGLNCSGFAKWVVDGILKPITGERLSIEPLKASFGVRGSSFSEPYEERLDPFFGLDWTRNLASEANTVLRSPDFGALSEIEVRSAPISSLILRNQGTTQLRAYPGFLTNAGFGFEGIHPLLYTLAIDEPGRIYLAAISNELNNNPRMRQFFHIAVLVPFFNEQGTFQVVVFESAEETSFTSFKNRYPGHLINLVRIPVERAFNP
jgi:hypothetical protein